MRIGDTNERTLGKQRRNDDWTDRVRERDRRIALNALYAVTASAKRKERF